MFVVVEWREGKATLAPLLLIVRERCLQRFAFARMSPNFSGKMFSRLPRKLVEEIFPDSFKRAARFVTDAQRELLDVATIDGVAAFVSACFHYFNSNTASSVALSN
ncbi:MAG: hypothetical protein VKK63_00335 [Synechococcus sp.]|nr:hypothetical protein [Synechococcus sp.]